MQSPRTAQGPAKSHNAPSWGSLYHYKAVALSNYDGDSMRCDVFLGMGFKLEDKPVRLFGIDTPEIRGKSEIEKRMAEAARWLLKKRLKQYPEFILQTIKDESGKYGRLLGRVHAKDQTAGYICMNDLLVDVKLAQPYLGFGERVPWPEWYQTYQNQIDPFLSDGFENQEDQNAPDER